jgi:hypothetical protein
MLFRSRFQTIAVTFLVIIGSSLTYIALSTDLTDSLVLFKPSDALNFRPNTASDQSIGKESISFSSDGTASNETTNEEPGPIQPEQLCGPGNELPLVYLYDIPESILPRFEFGVFAYDWLEYIIWKQIETYECRTMDPTLAQYYFVPHIGTLLYHKSSFNKTLAGGHLRDILMFVQQQFTYWNRTAGADHVLAYAHDRFSSFTSQEILETFPLQIHLKNTILILDHGNDGQTGDLDFSMHKDIFTVPPSWSPQEKWLKRGIQRKPWKDRKYLTVFRGSFHLENLRYSKGVRQALYQYYQTNADPEIIYADTDHEAYISEMAEAKFCLHLLGYVTWSERLGTIVNANCIPVIISDHLVLPFWQDVNWSSMVVRIQQKDVLQDPSVIKRVLSNITEAEANTMEANLAAVRPSLTYHMPAQRGDIFYRIMRNLGRRYPRYRPL